jgi:hypothetical protein
MYDLVKIPVFQQPPGSKDLIYPSCTLQSPYFHQANGACTRNFYSPQTNTRVDFSVHRNHCSCLKLTRFNGRTKYSHGTEAPREANSCSASEESRLILRRRELFYLTTVSIADYMASLVDE